MGIFPAYRVPLGFSRRTFDIHKDEQERERAIYIYIYIPSPKLTAISPLKINGWKMIHFLLGQKAYFQWRLLAVSCREGFSSATSIPTSQHVRGKHR